VAPCFPFARGRGAAAGVATEPDLIESPPVRSMFAAPALTLATAWYLTASAARAEEPVGGTTPKSSAATAVRVAGSLQALGPVGLGAEVSRRIMAHAGLDVTASYEDFQHGHSGVGVDALARYFPFSGPHAFSLGLGPSLLHAREYGSVGFLQGELAYEFRETARFSVLVGAGAQIALNNSGRATCPDQGFLACFLWTDHYSAGDVAFRMRLALGAAF